MCTVTGDRRSGTEWTLVILWLLIASGSAMVMHGVGC